VKQEETDYGKIPVLVRSLVGGAKTGGETNRGSYKYSSKIHKKLAKPGCAGRSYPGQWRAEK